MRNYITFQVVRKNIFRSSVHHIAYRLISITFPGCESYNAHKPLKYTIRGVTVQFTLEKARMLASFPPPPPPKKNDMNHGVAYLDVFTLATIKFHP